MAIITFWNNQKEQSGKTASVVAIATYMAIEHNIKTLIISTTNKQDAMERCFWEEEKKHKFSFGIFGPNTAIDSESGVAGLVKMVKSHKLTPQIITNYTKVVFRDRLEVLLGDECENIEKSRMVTDYYPEIIKMANQYYDRIFIDLDYNVAEEVRKEILDLSDVIVLTMNQRLKSINDFMEQKKNHPIASLPKTLLLIPRFDKYSKYNAKNITRYLGEKNQVLTVPYNTLFFEACEEAGVPDLFLRFRRKIEDEDRNAIFITEIKRACEHIIYRIQTLQAGM